MSRLPPRLALEQRRVSALGFMLRQLGVSHLVRSRRLRAVFERAGAESLARMSEMMWREAALELGAEVRRLSPRVLEFRRGSSVTRISNLMTTSFADLVSGGIALDKPLALRLLAEADLPVPEHVCVDARDQQAARAFLERIHDAIVAKPTGGEGGAAVIGNIRTSGQLAAAMTSVGRYGSRVLLERQVTGDSYRLLFLDGRLLDIVRRELPRLTGDGVSSVGALLLAEFERRIQAGAEARGFKPFDVDLDCLFTLAAGDLELASVPAAGTVIVVKSATNYSGPELSTTALGGVCEEIVASARRAAAVLGMRLAGVDVVTASPRQPLAESGGVILEVNAPGLHHHYNVADRARATRVAVPILASLLGLDPG